MRLASGVLVVVLSAATAATSRGQEGGKDVLWLDPGPVDRLDLRRGPETDAEDAPRPPFRFIEEERTGHSPKIVVADAKGRRFGVKFGDEVHAEVFASRLVWACGYQVEPMFYVADGRIDGASRLIRAAPFVASDGSFRGARFKGPHEEWHKLEPWRWDRNPFVGTRELAGLKILTMFLSNWDDKDARDVRQEPNTGILLERKTGRRLFAVTDWGSTLGRWGPDATRWNCEQYAAQSPQLLLGVEGGTTRWGVERFAERISDGITADDLAWLLERLAAITDRQLRDGLEATGATPEERSCFVRAVGDRVDRLRRATGR